MRLTLFCRHSPLIDFLKHELEHQRTLTLHERNRAEVAIAELLLLKVGTTALRPNEVAAMTEPEKRARDLLENPEFMLAGAAE